MESETAVDIVVIGAGISGLGVAVEASRRGFSVVLLERSNTLAAGTSANSLRIIHGGFRYLQTLAIGRVLSSCAAQAQLVRKNPELFSPLPCLMSLNKYGMRSKYPVSAAIKVFRVIAAGLHWPPKDNLPQLRTNLADSELLRGSNTPAVQWWGWQLKSHQSLAELLAQEGQKSGVKIELGALVTDVKTGSQSAQVELETGRIVRARIVIDCRGSGVRSNKVKSHAVAFNLLLNKALDPIYGVGFTVANRLLFAVPRRIAKPNGALGPISGAVGTWYLPSVKFSPGVLHGEKPEISEQQIDSALSDLNAGCPAVKISRADVSGVEAGVLPCISSPGIEPVTLLGRERIEARGRVVTVISTKYTTFETQARLSVNAAEDLL